MQRNSSAVVIFATLAVILFIAGCLLMNTAFDKKDSYYLSDSGFSVNAYVGGDAYNYIINGTYFIGYLVISVGSFLGSLNSLFASLYFANKKDARPIEREGAKNNQKKASNDLPPI